MLRGLNSARTPATRCSRLDCDIVFRPCLQCLFTLGRNGVKGGKLLMVAPMAADSAACLPYSHARRTTIQGGTDATFPSWISAFGSRCRCSACRLTSRERAELSGSPGTPDHRLYARRLG